MTVRLGRVRVLAIVIAAGTVGALPLHLSPAEAAKRLPCSKKGSKTLAASEAARVFRAGDSAYGCLYSTNRRWRFHTTREDDFDFTSLGLVRLAGPFLAFEEQSGNRRMGDIHTVVDVIDLRSGRTIRQSTSEPGARAYATDLELQPNAAMAWIRRVVMSTSQAFRSGNCAGR